MQSSPLRQNRLAIAELRCQPALLIVLKCPHLQSVKNLRAPVFTGSTGIALQQGCTADWAAHVSQVLATQDDALHRRRATRVQTKRFAFTRLTPELNVDVCVGGDLTRPLLYRVVRDQLEMALLFLQCLKARDFKCLGKMKFALGFELLTVKLERECRGKIFQVCTVDTRFQPKHAIE